MSQKPLFARRTVDVSLVYEVFYFYKHKLNHVNVSACFRSADESPVSC